MIPVKARDAAYQIRPVTQADLDAVLAVYRQCEDFLALGPVATASMAMVQQDLELSREAGGLFCGIFAADGTMAGIVDYVPHDYLGDPHTAFLELLMIAGPYRNRGIGQAVVSAVEEEVRKDPEVTILCSGVQVNNPQAVRFWQRNGYRIVSEPKLHPDQTTAVDLRKELR